MLESELAKCVAKSQGKALQKEHKNSTDSTSACTSSDEVKTAMGLKCMHTGIRGRREKSRVCVNKQNRRVERGRTAEGDRERKQETETEGDRVRNTSLLQGTLSVQLMSREF